MVTNGKRYMEKKSLFKGEIELHYNCVDDCFECGVIPCPYKDERGYYVGCEQCNNFSEPNIDQWKTIINWNKKQRNFKK